MNSHRLLHHSLHLAVVLLLAAAQAVRADVTLHTLFSDNAVLQRGMAVPVWGWADEGERVTVEFRGQKVSTIARNGQWMVRLKKLQAGGPDEMKVSGKNALTLRNVLVGEVWIASGQSNMEWGMRSTHDAENEIAKTSNPQVRLYTVPKLKADRPTNNVPSSWLPCEPVTSASFSAVAYYFARDLQKALGVPVGIIHTSWGGSPAEVWIREGVLAADPDYKRDLLDSQTEQARRFELALAQWQKDKAAAEAEGKKFERRRPSSSWKASELYNGMIAPLIPYAFKGAIWYQGESNAGRAHQYRRLFPDMIDNWRHDWGQGDFAFLLVQLAPFMAIRPEPTNSAWAELREAQLLSTRALPKVGMAVITDVGDEKDIHPRRKEPVGARLALSARHVAYGEKLVHSGPLYKGMKARDGKVTLSFDHAGQGLEARPLMINGTNVPNLWQEKTGRKLAGAQTLTGFAIAGEDQKFVWADAVIEGDKVVVSSPDVTNPVAVRYGWADFPLGNLWNKDGLPATPFRTDKFPMITEPKSTVAAKK